HSVLPSFPTRRSSDLDLPPADLGLDFEVQQRGEAEALYDFAGSPAGRRPAPGGGEVRCVVPLALHRCRDQGPAGPPPSPGDLLEDRKSTRLNSSHQII